MLNTTGNWLLVTETSDRSLVPNEGSPQPSHQPWSRWKTSAEPWLMALAMSVLVAFHAKPGLFKSAGMAAPLL